MPSSKRILAFDVDASSLLTLCEALPEWDFESREQASATSLTRDETIEAADLLVLGAHEGRAVAECAADTLAVRLAVFLDLPRKVGLGQ